MLPYAYLPSTVSFWYTDILRGCIAQRCMWEHGRHLGFTSASVVQKRNPHDLLLSLEQELPVYLTSDAVVEFLSEVTLGSGYSDNLRLVCRGLLEQGIVAEAKLVILDAWLRDCRECLG